MRFSVKHACLKPKIRMSVAFREKCSLNVKVLKSVEQCAYFGSRRLLSKEPLSIKIGVDTAENPHRQKPKNSTSPPEPATSCSRAAMPGSALEVAGHELH